MNFTIFNFFFVYSRHFEKIQRVKDDLGLHKVCAQFWYTCIAITIL